LDAATSAELSFNRVLDGILAEVSEPIRGAIRGERRTLGQLVNLLSRADSLPVGISEKEIRTGVVEPRNRAMHKGLPPTSAEAYSAAQLAMKIARIVLPLRRKVTGESHLTRYAADRLYAVNVTRRAKAWPAMRHETVHVRLHCQEA
jgi:hypothetical protein